MHINIEGKTVDKKKLQEERMRGYFLTAARDLIRSEGIRVVSTRNVADRAGYSYATLYNYFKDVRDLIFSCAEDFLTECREYIMEQVRNAPPGQNRLKSIYLGYAKFFVQYPGIFELLYEQQISDISTRKSDIDKINSFFESLTDPEWKESAGTGQSSMELRHFHKMALHGLLLFYLNSRSNISYNTLIQQVETLAEFNLS
jgi:AcrR family transcriptional regulator